MPEILWRKKGSELVGIEYEPLFPYFADLRSQNAFRTVTGGHVTTEDGTGIVHTAPGFGEEDHAVLKGSGVPTICPIDAECRFTPEVADYAGLFVKDADKRIIERLKAEGKLARREQVLHSYPHCWRCDHPLIYRAIGSWFVKIDPVKPKMLAANAKIRWVPEHIKNGRFGKWLEGARDWAISRSRYWGNPLPIWKCPDCGKAVCVGSRDELQELSGQRPDDLHKHFVDAIAVPCACGGTMRRIPEVLDCWFESGSMPYAQVHYPVENKKRFEEHFPADFISESLDQTRGWFYSLTVLAAALFDKPAFQNCIVSGMVLAADGKKMSKSLRNYTDPSEVIVRYGADALRLYLLTSPVMRADDLCFSDDGVKDVLKGVLIPLWNAYSFFVTYANIDGASPSEAPFRADNPLDRWILSVLEATVERAGAAMEAYELGGAIAPLTDFVDTLNNWYIRRSRRRFWKSSSDSDKAQAYSTLYRVLMRVARLAAPFIPFATEAIFRNLRGEGAAESVHLEAYPAYDASLRDVELERRMDAARKAVSMGRSLRLQFNVKTRQPLRSMAIVTRDAEERRVLAEMADMVREELNVKEVSFREDEAELVEYRAKANFRTLGKELGKDMKEAAALIEKLGQAEVARIVDGGTLPLSVAGKTVELDATKVEVSRVEKENLRVINEGSLTIGLDTEVTEELREEGDARDLVRGVQNLRKESGLEVSDRIILSVHGCGRYRKAFDSFRAFIADETLAKEIRWEEAPGAALVEGDEEAWKVSVRKA